MSVFTPPLANVVVDFIIKGGPIMYPILVVGVVAVCVVVERVFWWLRLGLPPWMRERSPRRWRFPRTAVIRWCA